MRMHDRQLRVLKLKYEGDPAGCRLVVFIDAKPEMTVERYNDSTTCRSRCRPPPLDGRSLCLDPAPLEMLTDFIKTFTMLIRPSAEQDDIHAGGKSLAHPLHVALPIGFKPGIGRGQRR